MSKRTENTGFTCANCAKAVPPVTNGSYRNHCPFCLCSVHVDNAPGDRQSECGGVMRPVGIHSSGKKGLQIVHRCEKCGMEKLNIVAESTDAPDEFDMILSIMREGAGK